MGGFNIAFSNVLLILMYMAPGYILCKTKMVNSDHLSSLSTILVYGCGPCMIVSSFLKIDFSYDNLYKMGLFFVVTLILQSLFMFILYLLLKKKFENSKYRILTIGSVLGNVGFFGMPLIQNMIPDNPIVLCYSSIYVVSMNILVFTVGVFALTEEKKYISLKNAVLNPSSIAFILALIIYIPGLTNYVPSLCNEAVNNLGKMTTPLCMIILGIRLAKMKFRDLFTNAFVYLTCLGKLVLFPIFCFALVYFLPFDMPFKLSVLILGSAPCGSIILNLAEIHKKEREMAANILLLSTLLCVITIPILLELVNMLFL